MSEQQLRLPLLLDTGAAAIGEYVVLDIDYKTVRRKTEDRVRMLAEYRKNLIRRSRERKEREAKPNASADDGGNGG